MKQLTLRGFDPPLAARLEGFAREHSISLNKAALILMRRGAGLSPADAGKAPIGSALDKFVGVWSAEDERELLDAVAELDTIDPEIWE